MKPLDESLKCFDKEGINPTPLDGVWVYRFSSDVIFSGVYEPLLCLILQGEKQVSIGQSTSSYELGECLLVWAHMPAMLSIKAPYLALRIDLRAEQILKVLAMTKPAPAPKGCFSKVLASKELKDVVFRLFSLLDKPLQQREFLSGLAMQELIFHLLNSNVASILSQLNGSVENAHSLLQNKALKATDVAHMVGYNSPSHFSREYLKMFKQTPKSG